MAIVLFLLYSTLYNVIKNSSYYVIGTTNVLISKYILCVYCIHTYKNFIPENRTKFFNFK